MKEKYIGFQSYCVSKSSPYLASKKSQRYFQTRRSLKASMGAHMHLVVSINRGPSYRPQSTIILFTGTPQNGAPDFGKPPFEGNISKASESLRFPGLKTSGLQLRGLKV